ncbi:prephenate dehydrogenase [Actinokineospora bangkokensis]|uniref:Prephenate dehydrogenase n=1 Tax=Actinokineospora bangkokensis TaxID=1193682 RepID=A0A1Q9LHF6_9PSEU|nr:prephenate dehydrogenase [Actinokineospora bangkokensis]OLR91444.1 prephenate dehydrogenase [Actinokineospora bangkokensis]
MTAVCVIGTGLIGGSLLRAAAAAGHEVWGATTSEQEVAQARQDGFDLVTSTEDALTRAAGAGAVVVIAVPFPAVDAVLRQVAEHAPGCTLTDVVSVKGPVSELVFRHTPTTRYVGGHPMAGKSASGWSAATPDLFQGAPWVLTTDEDTDLPAWREVADLVLSLGAHIVPTTATEHDAAVARISHLPHVLAAVLAAAGADGGPLALALAAGSFSDGTRVAATRPDLTLAMCEANRPALLAALDDALGRLGAARGALASTGALRATVTQGHEARKSLDHHRTAPQAQVQVDLTAPNALEELALIGTQGGHITALTDTTATATVPLES